MGLFPTIQSAQSLSGSGFAFEMQRFAASDVNKLDEQGLKALTANQLKADLDKLRADYQASFAIK